MAGAFRGDSGMKPLEEMGKFATVVIDPPWPVAAGNGSASNGYSSGLLYDLMPLSELAELPVSDTLADDALLFCWTVNRFVGESIQLLQEWGANYWFTMTWVKGGGPQLPNQPQFNAEWCVVGRKGKPQFQDIRAFNAANYWPRSGDSRKPEGFYDLLRRVTPGPRLDIFGRRRIAGFESWGNEAPEGPALPDHYQMVL